MKDFKDQSDGVFRSTLLCLAFAFGLLGCQTTPIRPMGSGGKTVTGQVQVATRKISVIGEFTARYSADEFQCEISKGGGVPLLMVHTVGRNLARIEGGGRTWQGNPRFAPGFLKTWIELREAFTGNPDPNICRVERNGRQMRVEFPKRNDRFVFLLDTEGNRPRL